MVTISISLDDDLNLALESLCADRECDKNEFVSGILRRHMIREEFKRRLETPALRELYAELADEDVALAEQGLGEYQNLLHEADLK